MQPKLLLNAHQIDILLHRLACQLIENHLDFSNCVLIGLQPRGVNVLNKLTHLLTTVYRIPSLKSGKLDITFFVMIFVEATNPMRPVHQT